MTPADLNTADVNGVSEGKLDLLWLIILLEGSVLRKVKAALHLFFVNTEICDVSIVHRNRMAPKCRFLSFVFVILISLVFSVQRVVF